MVVIDIWAGLSEKGLMVIFRNCGDISVITVDTIKTLISWFFAYTLENKCYGILLKHTFDILFLWHHILRHLRHLLALRHKSHKPPIHLGQLKY